MQSIYAGLTEIAQAWFRALGAFAPGASFEVEAVALIWECPIEEAENQLQAWAELGLVIQFKEDEAVRWQPASQLGDYALVLLNEANETQTARARHAAAYLARMRVADQRQEFYRRLPDYPQLCHAFDWAVSHDLELALALANHTTNLQVAFNLSRDNYDWATRLVEQTTEVSDNRVKGVALVALANALSGIAALPGEDRPARLKESLATYAEALQYLRAEAAPLDYATTQDSRGLLLSEIAALPGEDQRARLLESLAAYEAALKYRRPEAAPFDYAKTQNSRGNRLSQLAALPGEDRSARLRESLALHNEALRYCPPEIAPLDYAMVQNNRANRLSEIAALPGEDRRARLLEGLAAINEALKYRRPERTPLAYAMTQNNRGLLLSEIAALPGEDRGARLRESLAAYETALAYRQPDVAPLDYAVTQNNRASVLNEIARLPEEDQRSRLLESLTAHEAALAYCRPEAAPFEYAMIQNNRANRLKELAALPGEDPWARLRESAAAYELALQYFRPEVAPLDYALTQNNRASLLSKIAALPGEDRRARLLESLLAYDEALKYQPAEVAPLDQAMTLNNRAIRLTEIALLPGEDRRGRLREALQCAYTAFALFEQIGHAPYASAAAAALSFISQELSEFFGEVRAGAPLEWALPQAQLAALPAELREVCLEFVRARNQAEATKSAAAWQAAALTGRQLLESPAVARLETPAGTRVPSGSESEFELEPIRIETANCWNQLGCLLGGEQKYAEAVTALSEAIRLRPEEVILHCNRAKANLDLGNLAAAAADLARAAELDPDHPLLAALREELANKKDTDGRI